MKACRKCGETSENYSKDARNEDGLRNTCRVCVASRRRERYSTDPDVRQRVQAWNEKWRQANKDSDLAAKRAHYAADKKGHYRRVMRWRAANPETWRAISVVHDRKRKAAIAGGVSLRCLAAWIDSQAKDCFYCGNGCAADFHVDHFVPLARGGQHVLTNLRIACPACNLSKGAKDPMGWVKAAMFEEAA